VNLIIILSAAARLISFAVAPDGKSPSGFDDDGGVPFDGMSAATKPRKLTETTQRPT
jgi:hypothetical protein